MRIVFIGPPGAGKGTQAVKVASHFWLKHLSTGDALRAAREAKDPLGLKAAEYLDSGRLAPDELILEIVAQCLQQEHDAAGYLFDGFPRTRAQAEALDDLLERTSMPLTAAIEFVAPEDELLQRLSERGRADDNVDTIKKRLEEYSALTIPLVDYYQQKKILRKVDAVGDPNDVFERLRGAIIELSRGESPMSH